jgi:hypothetical protein
MPSGTKDFLLSKEKRPSRFETLTTAEQVDLRDVGQSGPALPDAAWQSGKSDHHVVSSIPACEGFQEKPSSTHIA